MFLRAKYRNDRMKNKLPALSFLTIILVMGKIELLRPFNTLKIAKLKWPFYNNVHIGFLRVVGNDKNATSSTHAFVTGVCNYSCAYFQRLFELEHSFD